MKAKLFNLIQSSHIYVLTKEPQTAIIKSALVKEETKYKKAIIIIVIISIMLYEPVAYLFFKNVSGLTVLRANTYCYKMF
jgi:hypothetical protein